MTTVPLNDTHDQMPGSTNALRLQPYVIPLSEGADFDSHPSCTQLPRLELPQTSLAQLPLLHTKVSASKYVICQTFATDSYRARCSSSRLVSARSLQTPDLLFYLGNHAR